MVTGANQGIGFAVVKRLSELGVTVVLTARNVEKGSLAVDSLRRIGLRNVHFFCLDVSDASSINAFVSWFRSKFGVLDILVIMYKKNYISIFTFAYDFSIFGYSGTRDSVKYSKNQNITSLSPPAATLTLALGLALPT